MYKRQDVIGWNLQRLADAVAKVPGVQRSLLQPALDAYPQRFRSEYLRGMRRKLGVDVTPNPPIFIDALSESFSPAGSPAVLPVSSSAADAVFTSVHRVVAPSPRALLSDAHVDDDARLVADLLALMEAAGMDFTHTFRSLAELQLTSDEHAAPAATASSANEELSTADAHLLLSSCARRATCRGPRDMSAVSTAPSTVTLQSPLSRGSSGGFVDSAAAATPVRFGSWLHRYRTRLASAAREAEADAKVASRQRAESMHAINPLYTLRTHVSLFTPHYLRLCSA